MRSKTACRQGEFYGRNGAGNSENNSRKWGFAAAGVILPGMLWGLLLIAPPAAAGGNPPNQPQLLQGRLYAAALCD